MTAEPKFLKQKLHFWAYVRTISQHLRYTAPRKKGDSGSGQIKVYSPADMKRALEELDLNPLHIVDTAGKPTKFGNLLHDYFQYRTNILNKFVEPHLMTVNQAKALYLNLKHQLGSKMAAPMNKQKKEKKAPAYLTAIVNMLIEANVGSVSCDYDPRELTTVTRDGAPLRTLARRVDGAFPCIVNPIAVWEIKEYYYTTTFGSRVADGVYESLLDGMELEELRINENIQVLHYLIVDDHYTWWECGRSYLCRIIDMLHMGYVDAVLFGSEVESALPKLVRQWVKLHRAGP